MVQRRLRQGTGIFFAAGTLSIVTHKRNSQMLNYTMWKPSSVLFFILGTAAFVSTRFM